MQQLCRREAIEDNPPLQPGDRAEAFADIVRSRDGLGSTPKIKIKEGLPRFVAWFSDYRGPKERQQLAARKGHLQCLSLFAQNDRAANGRQEWRALV